MCKQIVTADTLFEGPQKNVTAHPHRTYIRDIVVSVPAEYDFGQLTRTIRIFFETPFLTFDGSRRELYGL